MIESWDIFLSYSHEDKEIVQKIYEGLTKRGLKVWFDEVNSNPNDWQSLIIEAIKKSSYFIFCLSNNARKKIRKEKEGFLGNEFMFSCMTAISFPEASLEVIPVTIDDCGEWGCMTFSYEPYELFMDFENELDKLAVHVGGRSLSNPIAIDERTEEDKISEKKFRRGRMYHFFGENCSSLSLLREALKIKPNYESGWNQLGIVLSGTKQHHEAFLAFRRAVDINPCYYIAWFNIGVVKSYLEKYEEAYSAFNKALEINPKHVNSWNNMGVLSLKQKKFNDAIKAFDKVIKIEHNNAGALYNKGVALVGSNKIDEAINVFHEVSRIKPDFNIQWDKITNLIKAKVSNESPPISDLLTIISIDNHLTINADKDEMGKIFKDIICTLYIDINHKTRIMERAKVLAESETDEISKNKYFQSVQIKRGEIDGISTAISMILCACKSKNIHFSYLNEKMNICYTWLHNE